MFSLFQQLGFVFGNLHRANQSIKQVGNVTCLASFTPSGKRNDSSKPPVSFGARNREAASQLSVLMMFRGGDIDGGQGTLLQSTWKI